MNATRSVYLNSRFGTDRYTVPAEVADAFRRGERLVIVEANSGESYREWDSRRLKYNRMLGNLWDEAARNAL